MGNINENEAAYLSWFYSKKLDSEWEMKLTDKQKKKIMQDLQVKNQKELTLPELREQLFGKEE